MRIYLKKVVQYFLVLCIFMVLVLNLYKRDVWVYEAEAQPRALPWGPDFKRSDVVQTLQFDGPKIHDHILLQRYNWSLHRSFLTLETRETGNGNVYYSKSRDFDDRILSQLNLVPPQVQEKIKKGQQPPLKKILLFHGLGSWQVKRGQKSFKEQKCKVQSCTITDNKQEGTKADAILFHHAPGRPWFPRPLNQVWILFMLESPYHTPSLGNFRNIFNWTATYRHDSTIVAPYEKFVLYNSSVERNPRTKDYAAGKTKKVAWFVSNCGARNNRRAFVDELAKHIQVDIYGACGPLKCPRYQSSKCFDMLNKDYKFYLAFENSNCRDYITEKFFVNGLQHDVIPIVMGGAPVDYRRAAPYHSHIHVDDFNSAKDLAAYLHLLDKNDVLYNEYFHWKGTGHFINTYFWCRICNMLHDVDNVERHHFQDVEKWWRGPNVCIGKDSWKNKTMDLS